MSNHWKSICAKSDLTPNTGACALLEGEQVAIFWEARADRLFAVSNYDPIGEANVISRGIIGSQGDQFVVASPLYKQHFCLATGACLEQGKPGLKTYPIRECDGEIQLHLGCGAAAS
jgi:nitrite reductase (NADH) small subunit